MSEYGVYTIATGVPESNMSAGDFDEDDGKPTTMAQIYAKKTFKKTVRRLQEDSSSIWYDH